MLKIMLTISKMYKSGAERPSKSRSKSPDHDHITLRETFPITHHDNAETPKMLNNQKNLPEYQQRDIQDRDQNQGQDHDPHPKHQKKLWMQVEMWIQVSKQVSIQVKISNIVK